MRTEAHYLHLDKDLTVLYRVWRTYAYKDMTSFEKPCFKGEIRKGNPSQTNYKNLVVIMYLTLLA